MERTKQSITEKQGNRIFILETFSSAALFLPQVALMEARGFGILTVAAVCILLCIYFFAVSKAGEGVTMEDVLKTYSWAAFLYYIRFLFNGSFFYIYIISMVNRYLLPDRQPMLIGVLLIVLAYMVNKGGLQERGRVMEGIFWFVLLPVIFVLLLGVSDLNVSELTIQNFQWQGLAKGSVLLLALLHPIEFIWFYRGNIQEGKMKLKSILGITALFLAVFCVTVGSLGTRLTLEDANPVMSMAQGVAMPGGIMARLDIFLIAFWIVGVFCVFSGYLFYGNESLKHVFENGRKMGVLISYVGLFVSTNLFFSFQEIWETYFRWFLYMNLIIGFLLPAGLFFAAKRRKKYEEEQ